MTQKEFSALSGKEIEASDNRDWETTAYNRIRALSNNIGYYSKEELTDSLRKIADLLEKGE